MTPVGHIRVSTEDQAKEGFTRSLQRQANPQAARSRGYWWPSEGGEFPMDYNRVPVKFPSGSVRLLRTPWDLFDRYPSEDRDWNRLDGWAQRQGSFHQADDTSRADRQTQMLQYLKMPDIFLPWRGALFEFQRTDRAVLNNEKIDLFLVLVAANKKGKARRPCPLLISNQPAICGPCASVSFSQPFALRPWSSSPLSPEPWFLLSSLLSWPTSWAPL